MARSKNCRGSFLTLLELIIVLAIILFLAQKGLQSYFKPIMNQQAREMAEGAGINTANYRSVVGSTREKVQDIVNKRRSDMDAVFGNASR